MDGTMAVGLVAGTLTTVAFLPQLVKTWSSKSAKDVSFGMLAVFCAGVLLWLVYGVLIHSVPVILANSVTLILASGILLLKIKYG